jgi:hypothetical protein
MNETKLFLSSCNRRQLARRRPGHARWLAASPRLTPLLMTLTFVAAGAGAFLIGRFGF